MSDLGVASRSLSELIAGGLTLRGGPWGGSPVEIFQGQRPESLLFTAESQGLGNRYWCYHSDEGDLGILPW